jgi:hypothetical protein
MHAASDWTSTILYGGAYEDGHMRLKDVSLMTRRSHSANWRSFRASEAARKGQDKRKAPTGTVQRQIRFCQIRSSTETIVPLTNKRDAQAAKQTQSQLTGTTQLTITNTSANYRDNDNNSSISNVNTSGSYRDTTRSYTITFTNQGQLSSCTNIATIVFTETAQPATQIHPFFTVKAQLATQT